MFILNWKRVQIALLVLALIVSLAISGLSVTQAQASSPSPLFGDAGDASPAANTPNPAYVARSRYVSVNVGMLFDANGQPRDKQSLSEIALNLFADASYTGVLTNVKKDSMGTTWSGNLKGKQGYFYLVVVDNVFIAHVASTEGVYEVSWAGDNLYKAIQIDQSKFVDEDPSATYAPPGPVLSASDLGPNADSGATIDIMVVYTATTRAAEGSTAAMKARIALAVAEANTSYANDGVTTRLRLVHVEEYSYAETGSLGTDLSRLVSAADAYFTTVHSLRNTYAADMVSLIVENGGAYCGLANAIVATAATAFQVTARSCATGYYSFAHEFGHLQGTRHDTYVDPTNTPYSYGHGYVHRGTSTAQRWRTIMAYNDYCTVVGYSCTRLQWWSNPAKVWLGAPMGLSNTQNYLVLNNTDVTVANFRTAIIADNFSSTFNGSSTGWSPVYGTWVLASSAYYTTVGVPGYFASIKHTGVYGDLTYAVKMKRTGSDPSRPNYIVIRGNPGSLYTTKMWNSSYIFGYSNDGDFVVLRINANGTSTVLKTWTLSSAVVKGGWNTLKVVAVGSLLKYYINNVLVYSGADSAFKTGQVGVLMYRNPSGTTGDRLYIDAASLSTTPTADAKLDEKVAPGVEVLGGDIYGSP